MYADCYTNHYLDWLLTGRIDQNLNGLAYFEIKPGGAVKGLKFRLNASYNYVLANSEIIPGVLQITCSETPMLPIQNQNSGL
jgi:hypothetical protein